MSEESNKTGEEKIVTKNIEYSSDNTQLKISDDLHPKQIKVNKRKYYLIGVLASIIIGIIVYLTSDYREYNIAKKEYEKGNYSVALNKFKKLNNYKNSEQLYEEVNYKNKVLHDSIPPTITVISKNINIKKGEQLHAEGWAIKNVTVSDNVTEKINYSLDYSNVSIDIPGEYSMIISAEDDAGNKSSEVIDVIVKDIYSQEEIENAVKSIYGKEIPGLNEIKYEDSTVWIYLCNDGMAQAALGAKQNTIVKNSWNDLVKQFDEMSMNIYYELQIKGYKDIGNVNVALLNDLDKNKILYVTSNGVKFLDTTD